MLYDIKFINFSVIMSFLDDRVQWLQAWSHLY
jgi:hypothetical protein